MAKRRAKRRKEIDSGARGWEAKYLTRSVYASAMTLVVCLFAGAGLVDRYLSENRSPYIAAVISAILVDLANDDREIAALNSLRINPKLVAAAQLKANDMAEKGYFAHQTPEGYDSWHWFERVGYDYTHAGENLAVDFSESADVEKAWMQSPTHRDNILNENYTEIGIATAQGMYNGRMTTFAVQMFGRPSAREVANAVGAPPVEETLTPPIRVAQDSQILGETDVEIPLAIGAAGEEEGDSIGQQSAYGAGALGEEDGDAAILMTPDEVPWWAWLAVQPKETLRYAYLILGLLILFALFGDMEWEIHKHHYRHAMKAGAALATMSMLFIVADWIFFAEPVLAAVAKLIGQ